ncbi:hypothetical protein PsAD2_02737 [Pseudovibrio axinellae]|uniref:Lipoprotein n=1 Tax=Pseudovibrio axinellae TaxID=989403 RepID=A0A165XSV1_9HYPH|nr:hypothetical protein [Pseudovibrio axinellae]KZL18004.1 hypothetical protein PsAD2_02737 [Pseudovibrio axinellae]SER13840.1 hypothetical protein SAMN05421798_106243 [Pseudovibrio axinellae]
MKYTRTLALGLILLLAGCQTVTVQEVQFDKKPTSAHKKLLIDAVVDNFYDPYSIRDAELSNQLNFSNESIGYCGRLNAKNAFGGYSGRKYVRVVIKGDLITHYRPNSIWCKANQSQVKWNRFPELERL